MQENIPVKVGLMELLYGSTGVQYVIPAYQRNYTWTANREVKQLMEDISSILSGERTKHFLGIMIYLETSFSAFQRERSVKVLSTRAMCIVHSQNGFELLLLNMGSKKYSRR